MKPPPLKLVANNARQLVEQLGALDITVPLVSEGRTKEHRERYTMARFLAAVAESDLISYPIEIVQGDKPDFTLYFCGSTVGAECVEAVPQELYEIEALRERLYPDVVNFGHHFTPGKSVFTHQEKHEIARGESTGTVWMPESSRKNWTEALTHFVQQKRTKAVNGNYGSHASLWLLVHDEWPTALRFYPQQVRDAAHALAPELRTDPFALVFVATGDQLLCFQSGSVAVRPIPQLRS
jgi:hypothetical protein